jgi:outer membrane protein TolC
MRLILCALLAALLARAQLAPSGAPSGPTRPTVLPQSGRGIENGSAAAEQSASAEGGVSTVTSSVQVSGAFQGSTPASDVPAGAISLTLADAVRRGLATNLGTISAGDVTAGASAARIQALSALLPNIGVNASETVTQIDLAAYGFQFKLPAGFSGFSIPTIVGPFYYSQAQGTLSQSLLDLVARRNWKASKETERAAALSAKDARELVILAVTGTYLQTVTTAARVLSQRAQMENAQAVYNQALVRKQAGTNARIDVMRSLVELETQQQRLSSLEADLRKQKIGLARLIGLPLGRELNLVDALGSKESAVPDDASAIAQAFAHRSDLRAAEAQVRAAEAALSAAHAERIPSISVNGDYGVIGPTPASMHGVFAITGAVNVPVWDGGRIHGDIVQAEATLRQRRAELADQQGQVEQDVRTAIIELETAQGQIRLAATNRDYAKETLTEARDRFNAGVATTVEVVQAQEQVAGAEADYISSLFSFNLAKISLARATGEAEAPLPELLKGVSK